MYDFLNCKFKKGKCLILFDVCWHVGFNVLSYFETIVKKCKKMLLY